jgi:hypothetical protein
MEIKKQVQSFNTGRVLPVTTNVHGKKPDKTNFKTNIGKMKTKDLYVKFINRSRFL